MKMLLTASVRATGLISADESCISDSELAWTRSPFHAPGCLTPSDLGKHFQLMGACTILSSWSCDLTVGAAHEKPLNTYKQIR